MSAIAPRDQLKPIRIGENLVVNYKSCNVSPRMDTVVMNYIRADSVSSWINTIAALDQFKAIKIGEDLYRKSNDFECNLE